MLDALTVEVCELTAAGACIAGPPLERFTSTGGLGLIELDQAREFYTVDWLAAAGKVSSTLFYRVRVLKAGAELGTIDVDVAANSTELAAVDRTRYVGVVRGEPLTIRFRVQRPTAFTRVKINEVESNGGIPGDWIELFNTATVPLSLAGYVIKDDDNTHSYTMPAGTVIPAQGYYVVEEAALGFGLGAADAVRLYDAAGTLVRFVQLDGARGHDLRPLPERYRRLRHHDHRDQGFCEPLRPRAGSTKSSPMADVPGDWVELYNAGAAAVDISGYVFQDNDDTHGYSVPAGTILQPGAYYVLEEAAIGFGLGGADGARLFRTDGSVADSYYWTAHAATTYGRCPNGIGELTTTLGSTKGAANNCIGAGDDGAHQRSRVERWNAGRLDRAHQHGRESGGHLRLERSWTTTTRTSATCCRRAPRSPRVATWSSRRPPWALVSAGRLGAAVRRRRRRCTSRTAGRRTRPRPTAAARTGPGPSRPRPLRPKAPPTTAARRPIW